MDSLYEEIQIIKIAQSFDAKVRVAIEKWKKIMEGFSKNDVPTFFALYPTSW